MVETADCIVIGASVHGASVSFHLVERRLGKIVILDKGYAAGGTTAHSSGLLRIHYSNEPESRLTWESVQWFENWAERVGGDCGFIRTGFPRIVAERDADNLRQNVEMLQKIGVLTHLAMADEVRKIEPLLATDDFTVASYVPESGYGDPVLATSSLIDAARRLGAVYRSDTAAPRIMEAGGRVTGVETTAGSIQAPVVILAAHAWAPALARTVGLELPIDAQRHQVAFI